jgi:hypothetical protein
LVTFHTFPVYPERLTFDQFDEHHFSSVTETRSDFDHPRVTARAGFVARCNVVKQFLYQISVTHLGSSLAAGIDFFNVAGFGALFGQGDQTFRVATNSEGFCVSCLNTLVCKKLVDLRAPDAGTGVFITA